MLPEGQGTQRVATHPTTLAPPGKEETLGSRLSEVQGFIGQCDALADGSLSAIGFPTPSDAAKRIDSPGIAGKVMDIRSELLELRSKLETLKNALD